MQNDNLLKKNKTQNRQRQVKKGKVVFLAIIACLIAFITALVVAPFVVIRIASDGREDYAKTGEFFETYTAADFHLTATEHRLKTEDGLSIWASEVEAVHPRAVVIFLSGIRTPSVTWFYGHSKWLKEQNIASLLLEVRGHGNSDGTRICLGYEEVKDVRAAVDYLTEQPAYQTVPIIVEGISMGGAIALNAFGEIPEIDAVIAVSAYSAFEDVARDHMEDYLPGCLCEIEETLLKAYLTAEFGEVVEKNIPKKQVQFANGRKIFLIACQQDMTVPVENTLRILENAPGAQCWVRDTACHLGILENDLIHVEKDLEYCQKILAFIEEVIQKKED